MILEEICKHLSLIDLCSMFLKLCELFSLESCSVFFLSNVSVSCKYILFLSRGSVGGMGVGGGKGSLEERGI